MARHMVEHEEYEQQQAEIEEARRKAEQGQ
jgi:hypothetical protein